MTDESHFQSSFLVCQQRSPATYPSLQRNVTCNAVVIGGGITGALAAFHLAESGVKTVVIDQREIGTGSTSASTALLQYEADVPLRELGKRVGPAPRRPELPTLSPSDWETGATGRPLET